LYNYKNRGPFPPGKLNFPPQNLVATNEEVDPRSRDHPRQCCSAGSVAATVPHGSTGGHAPIDLQSSSRRSFSSTACPPVVKHMSKIMLSALRFTETWHNNERQFYDKTVFMKRRMNGRMFQITLKSCDTDNYATSVLLYLLFFFAVSYSSSSSVMTGAEINAAISP